MLIAGCFATHTAVERTADERDLSICLFFNDWCFYCYTPFLAQLFPQPFLLPVINARASLANFPSRLVRAWNLAELCRIEEAVKLCMGLPGLVVKFDVMTIATE